MSLELQLRYADLSIPCAIDNLEALKAELQPKLEHYKNLVVTEDGIKAAKEDKTKLNKLKKAIDEQRIAVKKKCLEPYEALEKECKEVEKPILEAVKAIDDQIKAFDEKERNDKLNKIRTAFYGITHPDWVRFESVLPEKWANKTEKLEKLVEEIGKKIDEINTDYAEITTMYADSPVYTAVVDLYRRTRNKADTLAYAVTLERQHQEEQQKKIKEIQCESDLNVPVSGSDSNNEIIPEYNQTAVIVGSGANQSISGTFKVTCTKQQLVALRDFMKTNKIKFEVVKG